MNLDGNFPLFVYGTLRTDRRYYNDVKKFSHTVSPAYSSGMLYYVDFIDDNGIPDVTVAFIPQGNQKVLGELFQFDKSVSKQAFDLLDEKEFNFREQFTEGLTREKYYYRTKVTCTNDAGDIFSAWSYVYVPSNNENLLLVNDDVSKGSVTEFIYISYDEYVARKRKRFENSEDTILNY